LKLERDGVPVEIKNFRRTDYNAVTRSLNASLSNPKVSNRDAIREAFATAVKRAPRANPSDLWHHVVYPEYKKMVPQYRRVQNPGQSWVRASGDALEQFLESYYNPLLAKDGIQLVALLSSRDRIQALKQLGIHGKVGNSKLDIAIMDSCKPQQKPSVFNGRIIGGLHVKASLAERVTDDVPCSEEMMKKGYVSYLVTLDVKSFPPSDTVKKERAYINKGELGSPKKPTDKRNYIEDQGKFDGCFSFNTRTLPSKGQTKSGRRIQVCKFNGQWDGLCEAIRKASRKRR